jgi:hypothetical protein
VIPTRANACAKLPVSDPGPAQGRVPISTVSGTHLKHSCGEWIRGVAGADPGIRGRSFGTNYGLRTWRPVRCAGHERGRSGGTGAPEAAQRSRAAIAPPPGPLGRLASLWVGAVDRSGGRRDPLPRRRCGETSAPNSNRAPRPLEIPPRQRDRHRLPSITARMESCLSPDRTQRGTFRCDEVRSVHSRGGGHPSRCGKGLRCAAGACGS